jgi:hypothetical protein
MKNRVKRFGQFIKESDEFDFGPGQEGSRNIKKVEKYGLSDLFECLATSKYSSERVLIWCSIEDPARDLTWGGIEAIVDPIAEEIEEFMDPDKFEACLFEMGELVDSSDNY